MKKNLVKIGLIQIELTEAPLPAPLRETVRDYQRASKAGATVRAYRSDAIRFDVWCREHGLPGSIYSVLAPRRASQSFTTSAMNSGPLSERM